MTWKDLEIVAFDGTPAAACAPVLPVVRWIDRDLYCKLPPQDRLDFCQIWYSKEDFEALCTSKLLTVLPLSSLDAGTPVAFDRAMLSYVRQSVFQEANIRNPRARFRQLGIETWWLLPDVWVVCGHESLLRSFLDTIADGVYLQTLNALAEFPDERQAQLTKLRYIRDLVEMGLAASPGDQREEESAKRKKMRWNFYILDSAARLRAGDLIGVQNIFECIVRLEFPKLSWDEYFSSAERAFAMAEVRLQQRHSTPRSRFASSMKKLLERLRRDHQDMYDRVTLQNPKREERLQIARNYAAKWSEHLMASGILTESRIADAELEIQDWLNKQPPLNRILLTQEQVWYLATRPFFWFFCSIFKFSHRDGLYYFSPTDFHAEYSRVKDQRIQELLPWMQAEFSHM